MAFVTWASLSSIPGEHTHDFDIPHLDKVVHFCFYFGATVLGTFFVRETVHGRMLLAKTLLFVVLGAIMYGIIIEVLQYNFTLSREGDPLDALANSCGAISGALVMKWLFSGVSRLKWK